MKSFFSIRRTRYTAAVMLFVWLMSIGIGVANACLIQQDHGPRGYSGQGRSGIGLAASAERHAAPDHFANNSVHNDGNILSPGKMTCLHFCVAELSTLPTDHLDGLAHLGLFPLLFLNNLLAPATDQTSTPEASASLIWSEPPVFIRYLRIII